MRLRLLSAQPISKFALAVCAVIACGIGTVTTHSQSGPSMLAAPAVQNVWLTRQGNKIPPANCLLSTNSGEVSQALSDEIPSHDLGGFAFDVEFDPAVACVEITEGEEFEAANAVCGVEDSKTTASLGGTASIECATIGEGQGIDELAPLADISVQPRPIVYSENKPNQGNHAVTELNVTNCELTNDQSADIPVSSCVGAAITFRYLEGDVEPDCVVDALDAQNVAFRWGVSVGSSLYKDFVNLEPAGEQADSDIDLADLQFVFGRFGSTCDRPHPPQPPLNATG
jgi:hypothetical protein